MEHEAVRLLSEYIKLDTTNPPGNEIIAAEFFKKIFDKEKIEYKTYESGPKRVFVSATLKGTGEKKPIILLNHMDVVPADATEWSFDPFSGEVKDGYILGRGALDMKSIGIMELLAFLAMKRESVKINRDLIFLATPDEETGGEMGVEYLLDKHPDDFDAEVVINEGGFGVSDILPTGPVQMIATGEKGICWLKLTREGEPGHGSAPHDKNALELLSRAIMRVVDAGTQIKITPVIAEYFKNLATGWEFLAPYAKDGKDETLIKILGDTGLINMPQIRAMVKNTISFNMMKAGYKTNVIPSYAEAELDIRLLPGEGADKMIEYVKEKLADDEITITPICVTDASISPDDNPNYKVIEEVYREKFSNTVVTQSLLIGTSDSRFFREKGIPSYGICPAFASMADVSTIHGIDERIATDEMIRGTDVTTEIVRRLCTQ
jgi:acetylornithine deacetylase/succinyl-diaminopimelate desuccinylase-like protein